MRWTELFDDLEGQLEAAARAELDAEVADRTRRELALIRLVDRVRAAGSSALTLTLAGQATLCGRLADVGPDWLLLDEPARRQAVVPLAAVLSITGAGGRAAAPGSEGQVHRRLTLGSVLRGLARDRAPVSLLLTDASVAAGTIDRVGADFLELAEHGPGETRRRADVQGTRLVPFAALSAVRSS